MTRLPEHSLMLTDRMTMAHSLEARSPFLDHGLVEFLAAFPSTMKIRGRTLKYALRRLAGAYLPAAIVRRQKQGFMFPIAYWLRNELYAPVRRFLAGSSLVREGVFQEQAVLNLVDEHRRGQVDNHVRIWMLLNLDVWHQIYIERCAVTAVEERLRRSFC
jgi:asparagine synthase (glutamine-hydrolysing)